MYIGEYWENSLAGQLKSYHRYIAGIDVGGTFTDLLLVDGKGNLLVEKGSVHACRYRHRRPVGS